MTGNVSCFGGAGISLTRVLTAMSAMIYRAPDSTGIAIFGDDFEPIRVSRTVGSVTELVERLHLEEIYRCPETDLLLFLTENDVQADWRASQRRVLVFEGLTLDHCNDVKQGKTTCPDYDELVDLNTENPRRLSPGWPGRPSLHHEQIVKTEEDLIELIRHLINNHDLSPVVIQSIVRRALHSAIASDEKEGELDFEPDELLSTFDRFFDRLMIAGSIVKPPTPQTAALYLHPQAMETVFHYLAQTPIRISADYDRDGVRCVFRLIDAVLLSRLPVKPDLKDSLEDILNALWPKSQRAVPVDWRRLYAIEKAVNVYGWAAASSMIYLQREEFLSAFLPGTPNRDLMTEASLVPGRTDPISLRYFSSPIIAHGRWATQSPVNEKNAHPFTDEHQQRAIVLPKSCTKNCQKRKETIWVS